MSADPSIAPGRPPSRRPLLRTACLAAAAAGLIFAGIQPVHPPDALASVTTGAWATVVTLKFAMCLLFLVGLTGLYLRQVDRMGAIGLAGFALLIVSWWLQSGFVFVEVALLPVLAVPAPAVVDSFLGLFNGVPGPSAMGAMPALYSATGLCYMAGGLLFGIATWRAGVLPRPAAALLAVAAVLTPLAALLPHEIQRFAAVPVGLAIAWLGLAAWAERRTPTTTLGSGGPEVAA